MALPTNMQFLYFLVAIFVGVSLWLVLSWLRITRLLDSGANSANDLEIPPNIVLEAVVKDQKIASQVC
jgi:hypothetical protein